MRITKATFQHLFQNFYFICVLYIVAMIICAITKADHANNFSIFRGVFNHTLQELPLYELYPNEYSDRNHYGVLFSLLIAPFSILSTLPSLIAWLVFGAAMLLMAIRKLPIKQSMHVLIAWFILNEAYTSACMQQYNTLMVAMIVMSFVLVEQRRDFLAAFFIVLGTLTKLYGVVGLAFFLFSNNKPRFILSCVFWSIVLFILPATISSMDFVMASYQQWFIDLSSKNAQNLFALYQNISALGMVRKISGSASYSDLWIIIPALLLYFAPFVRFKQYREREFRLLTLASTLLFLVLFSTSSESSTYIIAFVGIAVWYASTTSKCRKTNLTLLIFAFVFASLSSTDIFPKALNEHFIRPYALKALPCFIIWLKIISEMCFRNFSVSTLNKPEKHSERKQIDIITPLYNPPTNWAENLAKNVSEIAENFSNYDFRLIAVNDGSKRNFTNEECDRLSTLLPNSQIISYTENRGKGYAVRSGIAASKADFSIYTDYDFPYTTESLGEIINALERGSDIAIGARNQSYYQALTLNRKLFSWGSKLFNKLVLGMHYADAQGGLKGMNENGRKIMLKTKIERFLFDTEFIYLASHDRKIKASEVTVTLKPNISLPNMGGKVFRQEAINYLKIMLR